jgi:hypothetical protein
VTDTIDYVTTQRGPHLRSDCHQLVTHQTRGHRRRWEWSLSNSSLSASRPALLAIVMV